MAAKLSDSARTALVEGDGEETEERMPGSTCWMRRARVMGFGW